MTELIIAAWALSAAVLFFPFGLISRLVRRPLGAGTPEATDVSLLDDQPTELEAASSGDSDADDQPAELEAASSGDSDAVAPPAALEQVPRTTKRRLFRFLGTVGTLGLYAVFIVGSIYLAPRALARALGTDHPVAAISSQSMYPALKRGDMVLMEAVDKPEDLEVGDIISFENEDDNHLLIHRIVMIDGDEITTKGDARLDEDPPIDFGQVIGRAVTVRGRLAKIPYLGNLTILFGSTSDPDADRTSPPISDELLSDEQDAVPPPAEEPPVLEPESNDRWPPPGEQYPAP